MKHRTIMLKPASALCNMRCRYCFYFDILEHREDGGCKRMSQEDAAAIIEHTLSGLDKGDSLTYAFQGGSLLWPDWISIFFLWNMPTDRQLLLQ